MEISNANRRIVTDLEQEFAGLLQSLEALTKSVAPDRLYRSPPVVSIGENIVRSAAVLERTFGGLTANLWDDPFEWTLPESLSSPDKLIDYLTEVDAVRRRAFSSITDDSDLLRYISVPSGEPMRLLSLLLETLVRASNHQGRAVATLKMLSDVTAPGFII
jgi:hypothetical protein